jgi:hypothetical protein
MQSESWVEKLSNLPETVQIYRDQRSCSDTFEWSSSRGLSPGKSKLNIEVIGQMERILIEKSKNRKIENRKIEKSKNRIWDWGR